MHLPFVLPQLFVDIEGAAVNAAVGARSGSAAHAGLGCSIQIAAGDLHTYTAFAMLAASSRPVRRRGRGSS